eukprot:166296_1
MYKMRDAKNRSFLLINGMRVLQRLNAKAVLFLIVLTMITTAICFRLFTDYRDISPSMQIVGSIADKRPIPTTIQEAPISDALFSLLPSTCSGSQPMSNAFNGIYEKNSWGSDESGSGKGSTIKHAFDTSYYLKNFINKYKIQSFADIPCGDVNWQFSVSELNTMDIYFGGDISSVVINQNKPKFQMHRNKVFQVWDLTQCKVPQYILRGGDESKGFDMVLTRDVIQHLPLRSGLKFVQNVVLSDIKYWAVTSYPDGTRNTDIPSGSWYQNNLEIEPFNLPAENILLKEKSHKTFAIEEDYFVIYKIDERIKSVVRAYDVN